MTRLRLLDLFCGAGGAAMGYHRAGFEVVGVDIEKQDGYPFEFIEDDALDVVRRMVTGGLEGYGTFHAVHASPPCQAYSALAPFAGDAYPRLISAVREELRAAGLPYVIENVVGARRELIAPFMLCGSSFGLGVRRHRLFESNVLVTGIPPCLHGSHPEPIDVTGSGASQSCARKKPNGGRSHKPRDLDHAREVMGIDWMSRRELSQAIPPDYTEFIGRQLLAAVGVAA